MRRTKHVIAAAALALSLGACASGGGLPTSYASYAQGAPGPVAGGWAGRNAEAAAYVHDTKHGEANGG